jgi:hypothetical protein
MAAGDGILWADGFDLYTGTEEFDEDYTVDNSGTRAVYGAGEASAGTSYTRHATKNGLYVNNNNRCPNIAFGGSYSHVIVGLGVRELHTTTTWNRFQFWEGTTLHVYVRYDYTTKQFTVYRGDGTLLGTSSALPYSIHSSFGFVEIRVKVDNSAGEVEMRFNGSSTPILNLTSQDTRNGGTSGVLDSASFASAPCYVDDLYVVDASVGTFLGDVRIEGCLPTGAGNYTGWTPSAGSNYQCVDENNPNGDTDYVSASAAATADTYAMENVTPTTGTVYAVQTVVRARKDDGGTREIRPRLRLSGTDTNGTTVALGTTYRYWKERFTTKPGGGAWSISDVNSVEAGQELVT